MLLSQVEELVWIHLGEYKQYDSVCFEFGGLLLHCADHFHLAPELRLGLRKEERDFLVWRVPSVQLSGPSATRAIPKHRCLLRLIGVE